MNQKEGETINITSDGKITKMLIRSGTGKYPKDGERVLSHFIGRIHDTKKEYNNTYNDNHPYSFIVGHEQFEAWSLGAKTMREGEKALFVLAPEYGYGEKGHPPEIPPNSTLEIEAELIEILETFEKPEDAANRADQLCIDANTDFRAGHIDDAIQRYTHILTLIEIYQGECVTNVRTRIQRNLSVCYSKQKDWEKVIKFADEVLNKVGKDPKALFKKAEAALELEKLDIANEAIESGLTSKNPEVFRPLENKLKEMKRKEQVRQDNTYAAMLGKH